MFVESSATSLLPCPEHYIRFRSETQSSEVIPARQTLPLLELDVIRRENIGKKCLDFNYREESSGTDSK